MVTTNQVKFDNTARDFTAYCDDDSGETEIGPSKFDDANNRFDINCESADFQTKYDDTTNKFESRAVDDACCNSCGGDCEFSHLSTQYIKVTIDCTVCSGNLNGTYILQCADGGGPHNFSYRYTFPSPVDCAPDADVNTIWWGCSTSCSGGEFIDMIVRNASTGQTICIESGGCGPGRSTQCPCTGSGPCTFSGSGCSWEPSDALGEPCDDCVAS